MDEQKKEMSAQVQPETAETLQTDEINEQTVQIEQAEVEMAAESAAEAEQTAQPEKTEPQAENFSACGFCTVGRRSCARQNICGIFRQRVKG